MDAFLNELAKVLNGYGPAVTIFVSQLALNGFFVWRMFRREDQQQKQIDGLHRAHNEIVIPLLEDCREVMAGCKEVIDHNSQIITGWLSHGRH